jgi:integrase/recombinase XerD
MKINELIPVYLKHMQALGRSHHTIRMTKYSLKRFALYLADNHIINIEDLTGELMEDYQEEIAFSLTAQGKPLSIRSQVKQLCTVRGFTRFLKDKDYLMGNPGDSIMLPKEPKRLPQSILTHQEINRLMNAPDMQTNTGYRDRVMLEILYDTAIRRAELSNIKLYDIDLNAGYMKVTGKGRKQRVVPLSQRVCDLIQSYMLSIRPSLLKGEDNGWLILNDKGGQIKTHTVWKNIKQCAQTANIKKNVTVHTFRHTCATHMLRNGAPVRHLQEMLGHESLESTQIYTRITINDLKEIHAQYHPFGRSEV